MPYDDEESDGIIYHYTSPEGFLGIMKSGQLWFTDIRYLNDKSEGLYFVKLLIEFAEKHRDQYPVFFDVVMNLLKENDIDEIKRLSCSEIKYPEKLKKHVCSRTFIFCASVESDSLHMWNYYVKNGNYQGYNLGLKASKLLKTFDTPDKNELDPIVVYYGKVLYAEKQQYAEIKKLAEDIENPRYVKFTNKQQQINLKSYIGLQGLFYKSPKFRDENEFRILLSFSDSRTPGVTGKPNYYGKNNQEIKEDFRTNNGLIVPFLKVNLPHDSISRVHISPITESGIAKSSVKELLERYDYHYNDKAISIIQSKIPIRY